VWTGNSLFGSQFGSATSIVLAHCRQQFFLAGYDVYCRDLRARLFFGISLPVLQVGGGLIVGIHRVPEAIFSYLNRNVVHEESRYGMLMQQVVEIGTHIYL
jgi:hypothetical protein